MLVGTRVISLDGSRPSPAAIVTRNLLRPFDVILLFVPLLSPLRQRVGDMAAGTIVVMDTGTPPPASRPPESGT